MTGPQFVGLGLLLFLACAGLHWLLWSRLAGHGANADQGADRIGALKRWLKAMVAVQVLGVLIAIGWLLEGRSLHLEGVAWVAPGVGLLLGNAFPLQLAVLGITRSAKTAR